MTEYKCKVTLWQRATLLWTPHQVYKMTFSLHWYESSWGRAGQELTDTDPACFGMSHRPTPPAWAPPAPRGLCSTGLGGMFSHPQEVLPSRGSSARSPHRLCLPGHCCKVLTPMPQPEPAQPRAALPWTWENHDFMLTSQNQGLEVQDSLCPHVQASSAPSSKCSLGSVTLGASSV